jgi:type IV pilus assembly protein PilA
MKHFKGFSLIELLIVLAILGILSAITLAVTADYTVKARLSDLAMSNRQYRLAIEQSIYERGIDLSNYTAQERLEKLGYETGGSSELVKEISLSDSSELTVIVIESDKLGGASSANYTLIPEIGLQGSIQWRCEINAAANESLLKNVCS